MWHDSVADALVKNGKPRDALVALQKAVESDPLRAPAYVNLINLNRVTGNYGAAEAAFKTLSNINPNSYMALVNMGKLRRDQDRLEEAAAVFEAAYEVATNTGVKNVYVYPHLPWLASALRRLAGTIRNVTDERRVALLKRAARVAGKSVSVSRKFQNDIPRDPFENPSVNRRRHQSSRLNDEDVVAGPSEVRQQALEGRDARFQVGVAATAGP